MPREIWKSLNAFMARDWNNFMQICFRIQSFFEKHVKVLASIVVISCAALVWYTPVLIGMPLAIAVLVFLIGTFSVRRLKRSMINLCIFLFVLGLIFSPVIILMIKQTHELNNPSSLINRRHSKILDMTAEFENKITEEMETEDVLISLHRYIRNEIPFGVAGFSLSTPTTDEVMEKMIATCWGRALVGYSILKNMGYNVYVLNGFVDRHSWLRVYEDGSFLEAFTVDRPVRPWVMFNESSTMWISPSEELRRAFFEGFPVGYILGGAWELVVGSALFAVPACAGSIYILISKRRTRFLAYLAAVFGALGVTIAFGCIGIVNMRFMPLLIIVAGGLYLRLLWGLLS